MYGSRPGYDIRTYEDANHQISVDKQDQEPNKYYEHKYYEYCSDEMSDTGADAFTVSVERLTAHAAQRADRDVHVYGVCVLPVTSGLSKTGFENGSTTACVTDPLLGPAPHDGTIAGDMM